MISEVKNESNWGIHNGKRKQFIEVRGPGLQGTF